jgi:hypothetical protein
MFIVKLINTDEGIIPEYYGDGELLQYGYRTTN